MACMDLWYSSAESLGAPGRAAARPLEKRRSANQAKSDKNTTQSRRRIRINGHQKPPPHPPIGPSIVPACTSSDPSSSSPPIEVLFPSCTVRLRDQAQVPDKPRSRSDQDSGREMGRVKVKVAPSPAPGLSAQILPPIASTSAFEIANPTPDPPRASLRERDFSAR